MALSQIRCDDLLPEGIALCSWMQAILTIQLRARLPLVIQHRIEHIDVDHSLLPTHTLQRRTVHTLSGDFTTSKCLNRVNRRLYMTVAFLSALDGAILSAN